MLKFDTATQSWFSSNQNRPAGYSTSFDVEFIYDLPRLAYRPSIPPVFSGYLHILYESNETSKSGEILPNKNLFSQIKDILFDYSFAPSYDVYMHDAYGAGELSIDSKYGRKELRFGDFSDNVSSRLVIGNIKYYCADSVEPFSIKLISSTTTNIVDANMYCSIPNNNGDAWIGTSKGLIFYTNDTNTAYHLDNVDYGLQGLQIEKIAFDAKSNMYAIGYSNITQTASVYVSSDHAYFYKLEIPNLINPKSLDVDGFDRLYVASDQGLFIIKLSNIYDKIIVSKTDVETVRKITLTNNDFL
jgi:ligand-binding sensor domain-containing protein